MKDIEQLRKDMMNARKEYQNFMDSNSRNLTEEEKMNEKKSGFFVGCDNFQENEHEKLFTLTTGNFNQYREVVNKMRETEKLYIEEAQRLINNNENKTKNHEKSES